MRGIEGWPFVDVVVAIVAGDDVAAQATADVFVAGSPGDRVVAALAMGAIVALTAGYAVVPARIIVRGSVLYEIVAPTRLSGHHRRCQPTSRRPRCRPRPPPELPHAISNVAAIAQNSSIDLLNVASILLELPVGRRTTRVALPGRRHNSSQKRRRLHLRPEGRGGATRRFYPTTIAVPSKAAHDTLTYM